MGISSNQARFLALTSRQVDLEHRIQQICQRRLRLSSELENTATSYNNQISNRQLYAMNTANSGIKQLSVASVAALQDENGNPYRLLSDFKYNTYNGAGTPVYGDIAWVSGNQSLTISFGGPSTASHIYKTDLGFASTDTPTEEQVLDAALRQGLVSIGKVSDEFTQSSVTVGVLTPLQYELKDWRTIPSLADELYAGDDVDAENKYDKTISEINAQDKKLQLEQTSIEVEYKAITSEKESVKKVLETNAQTSFKYFS